MPAFINIANLTDPDDPRGRSYREVNAARVHAVPLGALVELDTGVRLFVVHHGRDCDQTPLYYLCHDPHDTVKQRESFRNPRWTGGYAEGSLRVIAEKPTLPDDD